jgi:seryl-tRNA synthetase
MLTLKLITEETERVIRGLEKKHFKDAEQAINNVIDTDKKRREAQRKLDQVNNSLNNWLLKSVN